MLKPSVRRSSRPAWLALLSATLALFLTGCAAGLQPASMEPPAPESTMPPQVTILDVYPDQATYLPGQPAAIVAVLRNDGPASFSGELSASLLHLAEPLASVRAPVELASGQTLSVTLPLQPPADDFRGYGVDLSLLDQAGQPLATASTALDVLSHWSLAPRYGFLADFTAGERDSAARLATLSRYHVNVVQFYDWMWRHYALLPPAGQDDFVDGMGRALSLATVKDKIAQAHRHSMAALAYGAVYGAEPEFFQQHKDWALYRADGTPESLEQLFYIMNIAPGSPWNDVIVGEYVKAVTELDFDGIHMDQYGFPKMAQAGSGDGPAVDVAKAFPPLIDQSAVAVAQARPAAVPSGPAQVIFNNVGDWPTELTAPRNQAAVYIEVWPPNDTYGDLQQLIERGRQAAGGQKQVILAAYLTPFCVARDKPEILPQAEEAARLASAAIYANGGFHLLLGERDGVLCDPYYPKYATLRPEFAPVMRAYADFAVRYENWLADPALAALPKEAVAADGVVQLDGLAFSPYARKGAVWAIARQMPGAFTLSLVNLASAQRTLWNSLQEQPKSLAAIPVTLRLEGPVQSVTLASPDEDGGRAQPLTFTAEDGAILFTVPRLEHWDLIVVSMGG